MRRLVYDNSYRTCPQLLCKSFLYIFRATHSLDEMIYKSADYHHRQGNVGQMLDALDHLGQFEQRVDFLRKRGRFDEAVTMLEEAGRELEAAKMLKEQVRLIRKVKVLVHFG